MNSQEFDKLKVEVAAHLLALGPETANRLASELNAPHGNVLSALEELQTKEKSVMRLAFGFWDIAEEQLTAA